MKNPSKQKIPESKIIDDIDINIYKTGIFRAALELEIWDKLAKGLDTAEIIAAKEGWDLPGTQMLLDDLCTLKLLKKHNHQYRPSREAEYYLIPEKPTYMGKSLLKEFLWEGEGLLAETIRSGKRPVQYNATKKEMVDIWLGTYVPNVTDVDAVLDMSNELWKTLGIQPHEGMRILDIACGPAPVSLALAKQNAGVQVTLLDWERILETSLHFAGNLEVDRQVTTLAGDLWTIDFGKNQFDLVFLGFITHFFSPEENVRLFKKACDSLVSGGVIAIRAVRHEYPRPSAPELWFYAVSKSGAAYDFAQYRDMLERAGFTSVEDVAKQPIKAIKP